MSNTRPVVPSELSPEVPFEAPNVNNSRIFTGVTISHGACSLIA